MSEAEGMPFELNNYIFRRRLGYGANSKVFEVESIQYQRKFAAKVTEFSQSAMDSEGKLKDSEIECLIALDHPNIIKIYDYFIMGNYVIIILELCTGGSIEERLSGIHIPSSLLHQWSIQIVDAVKYCHEHSIAHRDIKPGNVFIDEFNRAKLADFGLSSSMKAHELIQQKAGTPIYAAPEILKDGLYNPFKADIFALGVTLYRILTGKMPEEEGEQIKMSFPEDFDRSLEELIVQMVNENPDKRPSIQQVRDHPFFCVDPKALGYARRRSDSYKSKFLPPLNLPIENYPLQRMASMKFQTIIQTSEKLMQKGKTACTSALKVPYVESQMIRRRGGRLLI